MFYFVVQYTLLLHVIFTRLHISEYKFNDVDDVDTVFLKIQLLA